MCQNQNQTNKMENEIVTGTTTISYHPIGMLDRDQRTTIQTELITKRKLIEKQEKQFLENKQNNLNNFNNVNYNLKSDHLCNKENKDKTNKINCWNIKLRLVPKSCQKVSDYLLLYFYILILLIHLTSAAPIKRMANHNGETDLWLNPCNASFSKESKELTPAVLKQLIRVIYQTANNALTNAKHNVEEYVQLMNKGDTLQSHHDSWKLAEEPFLYPEGLKIPKQFNESIESFFIDDLNDMDLLKTKDLSKLLLDTFERFQHLAVGIQVLLNDTKDDRKNQRNSVEEQDRYDFIIQSMTNDMKSVLCEIYSAIWSIEIEIPASRTITIDVMPESKRVIEDRRDRNLRDWIIYREYMNQLQFAVIVFDILEKRIATN